MAQSSQGEAKEKDIIDVTDDIVTLSCGEELSKALAWKVSRYLMIFNEEVKDYIKLSHPRVHQA